MSQRFQITRHEDHDEILDTATGEVSASWFADDFDPDALYYAARYAYRMATAVRDYYRDNPKPDVFASMTRDLQVDKNED